jgi:glutaminyl-peptide cyclotransferase
LKVTEDSFSSKTPLGEKRFVNIVASIAGERSDVIILASHYDTKLTKDYKFVGANDGASSTAVLIELARLLAQQKRHKFTLWFAFFDGEEAFCQHWDECSTPESPDNTYGSRRMVANLIDENSLKKIRALILMDMVGYRNLELGRDSLSSSWLVNTIWNTARDLGYEKYFLDRVEGVGGDDHVPFLKAGIDSIDIIQLNSYPYWHTPEDTLDKISSKSLKIVGDTVLASLPHIEEHLIKSETKK